jgi:hypothetical protein
MKHQTQHIADPALDMLEKQRAAHEARKQSPLTFQYGTINVPTEMLNNGNVPMCGTRVHLAANRELTKCVPAERRLNIIYAPLLAKTLCSDLCETIESFLKENRMTDTKADTAYFKHWREIWEEQLYSPDMPKDAEKEIRQLAQWWREDGTDNIVKSLRYAYANQLGTFKDLQSNTIDFFAWIFTAREIARAAAKHDDVTLDYLLSFPESKPYKLRRNAQDYSYKLQEFTTRLVVSAFGQDYDPSNAQIETGKRALYNRLALYDAVTALSEYHAKDTIEKAHRQCPAERCKNCELNPCKTLKAVTRNMSKS